MFTGFTSQARMLTQFLNIRPLAKLNWHIEVTNTSNQGKPKRESFSSVSVPFWKNPEAFYKSYSMFHINSLPGYNVIIPFIFLCKRFIFITFFRKQWIWVYFCNACISCISFKQGISFYVHFWFFKQPEIVFFAIAETQTDNFHGLFIHQKLCF